MTARHGNIWKINYFVELFGLLDTSINLWRCCTIATHYGSPFYQDHFPIVGPVAMDPNEFDVVFDVSWWLSSHFSSASLAVPDNRSILQQINMDPFSPLNLRKKFEMVTSLLVQGNYWRHGTSSQTTFFIENPLKSFTLAYYVYWQWFFIPDVK